MSPVARAQLGDFDRDAGQAGVVAPMAPWVAAVANSAVVAARTYVSRFTPSRSMTIVSMSVCVTTAGGTGDSNIDMGIYNAAGTTKLASTGATAAGINSVGIKNVALSASHTLTAGTTYYAAIATAASFPGTAPGFLCYVPGTTNAQMFGSSLGTLEFGTHTAGGTLPSSLTISATSLGVILALRES